MSRTLHAKSIARSDRVEDGMPAVLFQGPGFPGTLPRNAGDFVRSLDKNLGSTFIDFLAISGLFIQGGHFGCRNPNGCERYIKRGSERGAFKKELS